MPMYNHHKPHINISQCSHINTKHPLFSETMLQPMAQNHRTLRKATNWTSTLRSHRFVWLPCQRHNTYWRSTSTDSCRSKSINLEHFLHMSQTVTQTNHISIIHHLPGHASTNYDVLRKSSTTHSPCTTTSPATDSLHQHNTDNDPSIKFLVATLTTKDDSLTTRN